MNECPKKGTIIFGEQAVNLWGWYLLKSQTHILNLCFKPGLGPAYLSHYFSLLEIVKVKNF